MQHFYDGAIRRYILQFVRIFGSFTVQKGTDEQNNPIYEKVPARYGDMSREVAHVLKENSENKINAVPFISCYVNSLDMNADWRRYPQFEETVNVIEKKFNEETNKYEDSPGHSYNVTRYQPVPYLLTMDVDIWTSNTEQKLQLLEQILMLFNPTINLHTNQNALDWTSLTYCELTSTNWSSRSLPTGADNAIDIAKLTFQMPIFISPPVKVHKMNIINTILANLHTLNSKDEFDAWNLDTVTETSNDFIVTTLENYWIKIMQPPSSKEGYNTEITLLKEGGQEDSSLDWKTDVFDVYGELQPGISQIRLRESIISAADSTNDVVGTIDYHPTDSSKLCSTIDIDTLPESNLPSVHEVIDPQRRGPGPNVKTGQRYLLLDAIPSNSDLWGNTMSGTSANDIVEYSGNQWVISFDADSPENINTNHWVTILNINDQFRWNGEYWSNSLDGIYRQGFFRLYI